MSKKITTKEVIKYLQFKRNKMLNTRSDYFLNDYENVFIRCYDFVINDLAIEDIRNV